MSINKLILLAFLAFVIAQLNLYFAWTSHVGAPYLHASTPARAFLVKEITFVTNVQLLIPGVASYFANLARNSPHFGSNLSGLETRFFIDYEVIAFVLAIFAISLYLFKKKGSWVAIVRALEITSAAVLPLGVEIYLFDRAEFNIHASAVQVRAGLGWITNADVLYISTTILAATLAFEAFRYVSRKRAQLSKPDLLQSYVTHD